MGHVEFDLKNFGYDISQSSPAVNVNWTGNPLDPLSIKTDKSLGQFGAIPPFFIPPQVNVIRSVKEIEPLGSQSTIVYLSQMPLKVKRIEDKEWYTIPIEPLISISGKNNIIRRNVAKSTEGGTIKERWSLDDFTVEIQGVLISKDEQKYPKEAVKQLVELFSNKSSLEVAHELLLHCGIKYLAIESLSLPHTKGLQYQNYVIKAYSDSSTELLIK